MRGLFSVNVYSLLLSQASICRRLSSTANDRSARPSLPLMSYGLGLKAFAQDHRRSAVREQSQRGRHRQAVNERLKVRRWRKWKVVMTAERQRRQQIVQSATVLLSLSSSSASPEPTCSWLALFQVLVITRTFGRCHQDIVRVLRLWWREGRKKKCLVWHQTRWRMFPPPASQLILSHDCFYWEQTADLRLTGAFAQRNSLL